MAQEMEERSVSLVSSLLQVGRGRGAPVFVGQRGASGPFGRGRFPARACLGLGARPCCGDPPSPHSLARAASPRPPKPRPPPFPRPPEPTSDPRPENRAPRPPQNVTKAALRDRVAAKFVESEFEKTDMLVEIMFKCGPFLGGRAF